MKLPLGGDKNEVTAQISKGMTSYGKDWTRLRLTKRQKPPKYWKWDFSARTWFHDSWRSEKTNERELFPEMEYSGGGGGGRQSPPLGETDNRMRW